MDYDFEITRMKETLGLCLHSQQRLAEVQTSSNESIAMLAQVNVATGQSMERMNAPMERMSVTIANISVTMAQLQTMSANTAERLAEVEQFERESEQRWKHIDLTIAEIGDKLNGLIGYMDGQARKQQ